MDEVLILRDFLEDNHISMELYADLLTSFIKRFEPQSFGVSEYTPSIPRWLQNKKNGIRIARFYSYPAQIKRKNAALFHIIDQGYGHLIHFLDPAKTIITVHDLMSLVRWKGKIQGINRSRIPLLSLFSLLSLRKAQHLIAVSKNTKNDLIHILGCNPARISVIYSGIDPIYKSMEAYKKKNLRNKWFNDDSKRRILITGSQFYKNHETALKTLLRLRAMGMDNVQLVKTGSPTSQWLTTVRSYGLEDNVTNLGKVSRENMPEIYNAVDLLFFPSVYEGFGWPPLEAMACGIPVVASNAASLTEVMGDINTVCEPLNFIGFAEMIRNIFWDEQYRQQLIDRGAVQANKFTWNETIQNVMNFYRDVQKID